MNRVGVLQFPVEAETHTGRTDGGRRSRGVVELLEAALTLLSAAFILLTFPLTAWKCAKVVQEYERAVVLRLGRVVKGSPKGPGLLWFIPWLDVVQTVDLRTVSFLLEPQEVLTADAVPLKVDAVVFYRVVDPLLWVLRVRDGGEATRALARTALRATLGASVLTELLTQTRRVALRTEEALFSATTEWGVQVQRVELKELMLPKNLQRCMASEAEAVRNARAKLILAEGEARAAVALASAASALTPVAVQLRYLSSLSSLPGSASIVAFPAPPQLLHVFG